ncbi:hypothetical protein CVH13_00833, partial [Dehalococcoides mccartyi]
KLYGFVPVKQETMQFRAMAVAVTYRKQLRNKSETNKW